MPDANPLSLPGAGAGRAAGRHAGFQRRADFQGRRGAASDVDAAPEDIRDLAYAIIRVLDRESEAVGPWAGLLSDAELLEGLRHMMTLRVFDARMQMAQRHGKTSFYMQHMGERGGELRLPQGARARRHELSRPTARPAADRRRLSDARHDVPDLFQRARPR